MDRKWKRREKEFDEAFAFLSKVTHQWGFLAVVWIGVLTAIVTNVVISVVGVQELLRRLGH